MSDRVEFMLKYGRPDDVRKIVSGYHQNGIDNRGWALDTALKNPACPSDVVDLAATKGAYTTQNRAFKHPNLSKALHTKALQHSSNDVRESALLSHHTTDEQLIHHRENDPDFDVRRIAANILRNRHG
jgi:hypothetical protein